jgi:hypothetical protein
MGFGKMNTFIDIIEVEPIKDSEGFSKAKDTILASVRGYKEDRFASEIWANRAVFSEANVLFRFRKIPGIEIVTNMVILTKSGRYDILNVSDIKNRGMYTEVLAKKVVGSGG